MHTGRRKRSSTRKRNVADHNPWVSEDEKGGGTERDRERQVQSDTRSYGGKSGKAGSVNVGCWLLLV